MFGNKARQIDALQQQVAGLKDELAEARPYLADARAIGAQVAELLQRKESINYTSSQLAHIAYQAVLTERQQEVQDQLVAEYRAKNEQALLQRLTEETRQNEGEQIEQDVALMVQTDVVLRRRLEQEARETVWREAEERIAGSYKEQAAKALSGEEQRRTYFEQLNTQFRLEDELNLDDSELLRYIRHGDRLRVSLIGRQDSSRPASVDFVWQKITSEEQGWVLTDAAPEGVVLLSDGRSEPENLSLPGVSQSQIGIQKGIYDDRFMFNVLRTDMLFSIRAHAESYIFHIEADQGDDVAVITDCKFIPKEIEL